MLSTQDTKINKHTAFLNFKELTTSGGKHIGSYYGAGAMTCYKKDKDSLRAEGYLPQGERGRSGQASWRTCQRISAR